MSDQFLLGMFVGAAASGFITITIQFLFWCTRKNTYA